MPLWQEQSKIWDPRDFGLFSKVGILYKYNRLGIRIKNNLRFAQLLPNCHIKLGFLQKSKNMSSKLTFPQTFVKTEIPLAIKRAHYSALQNWALTKKGHLVLARSCLEHSIFKIFYYFRTYWYLDLRTLREHYKFSVFWLCYHHREV